MRSTHNSERRHACLRAPRHAVGEPKPVLRAGAPCGSTTWMRNKFSLPISDAMNCPLDDNSPELSAARRAVEENPRFTESGAFSSLDAAEPIVHLDIELSACLHLALTSFRRRSIGVVRRRSECHVPGPEAGMRLRMLTRPTGTVDGISLDSFRVGAVYEVGTKVACVFLAEGWAEIVTDDDDAVAVRPSPPETAHIEPLVLVVDDEPEVRRLTESLLTSHGLSRHCGGSRQRRDSPTPRNVSRPHRARSEHAGDGWLAVPHRAAISHGQETCGGPRPVDDRHRRRGGPGRGVTSGRCHHEAV